jgi:hypothetical protein
MGGKVDMESCNNKKGRVQVGFAFFLSKALPGLLSTRNLQR